MQYVDGGFYYMDYYTVCGLVQAVGLSGAAVTVASLAGQLGGMTGLIATLIPGIGWASSRCYSCKCNCICFGLC